MLVLLSLINTIRFNYFWRVTTSHQMKINFLLSSLSTRCFSHPKSKLRETKQEVGVPHRISNF